VDDQITLAKENINKGGFQVIGSYHLERKQNSFVICFTNDDLRSLSLQFNEGGALGSMLKAAYNKKENKNLKFFKSRIYVSFLLRRTYCRPSNRNYGTFIQSYNYV